MSNQKTVTQLDKELNQAIQEACDHLYVIEKPTPIDKVVLLDGLGSVFLKREDLTAIHCFKWRGAFNRMRIMTPEERKKGIVAASAGNHAQGIALAAQHFKIKAHIYIPSVSQNLKIQSAKALGGKYVTIEEQGDCFQEATDKAIALAKKIGKTFIHAYDDFYVTAGQGTIGAEIVASEEGPFDVVFIQLGGGGLAAGVACAIKQAYPETKIIGVEEKDQANISHALKSKKPVDLDFVDSFCDGTAMTRAGDLTFKLCQKYLDDIITVSNDDVCLAIQTLWESQRCLLEPSGALGFAGYLQFKDSLKRKKVLCLATGSNVDFDKFAWIARHAAMAQPKVHAIRLELEESPGSLLRFLQTGLSHFNITHILYGKIDEANASVVIGFEARGLEFDTLMSHWDESNYDWEEVVPDEIEGIQPIELDKKLLSHPLFFKATLKNIKNALPRFLKKTPKESNICYLKYYVQSNEVHVVLGLEFLAPKDKKAFSDNQLANFSGCVSMKKLLKLS